MDDQFNGRTDDDLFLDDFEPVADPVAIETAPPKPAPAAETPVGPAEKPVPSLKPAGPPSEPKPRGLGQSRHARGSGQPPRPGRQQRQGTNGASNKGGEAPSAVAVKADDQNGVSAKKNNAKASNATAPCPSADGATTTAPASAANTSTTTNPQPVRPASVTSEARLKSGANPRTKLTEEELAAKMEAMALASAEKMRRHDRAQRDQRDHELALARSVEEAKRRRAAEEEKRRRAEEDRRRMEDERAKNRERKLHALGAKEGVWEQEAQQEDQRSSRFGGVNGGVRGAKSLGKLGGGLEGSRYAANNHSGEQRNGEDDRADYDGRGRGPGRGGGGRGRGQRGGGRGGADGGPRGDRRGPQSGSTAEPAIDSTDEFPPLSNSSKPSKPAAVDTTADAKSAAPTAKIFSPLSPNARWDDEVEAESERTKAAVAQAPS